MIVRKAVIPAAGLGTRFLPATKVLAKEMMNVVDRPGIQYAVEEAQRAGIDDILIVTSRGKSLLEDHFDRAPELEQQLEKKGKSTELEEVLATSRLANVHSVRQKEPLGLGHAVLMAREHVGDEPFVVLLPDEIVPEPRDAEPALLPEMIAAHADRGAPVVAVREVELEEVPSYGIVDPGEQEGAFAPIKTFVEKPSMEEAPSRLASVGRYVLNPSVFDALEATAPGAGNEIQLTDGIQSLTATEGAWAYIYDGPIFDVGKKADYLRATIELALRRPDLAEDLRAFLREVIGRGDS
ncbi:MAG: UTP--glucose-1-phosphate uridylyltransferase [Actinomycetota bacterium]